MYVNEYNVLAHQHVCEAWNPGKAQKANVQGKAWRRDQRDVFYSLSYFFRLKSNVFLQFKRMLQKKMISEMCVNYYKMRCSYRIFFFVFL